MPWEHKKDFSETKIAKALFCVFVAVICFLAGTAISGQLGALFSFLF